MAKNQHSHNSSGEFAQLHIATAHSLMSSGPASTSHAFRLRAAVRQMPSSGEVIPVEIDPHLLPTLHTLDKKTANYSDSYQKTSGELTKVSSKIKQEAALTYVPVQHQKTTQETMNDKFTAYINRVKHGMLRTLSKVESAEVFSGHEKVNDEVWINDNSSTHMKIRKLPSIVGGKNVTFK